MTLEEHRKRLAYTQVEVAIKVGCSLSSYRMWEDGVTTPTEENQRKLNKVLGIEKEKE